MMRKESTPSLSLVVFYLTEHWFFLVGIVVGQRVPGTFRATSLKFVLSPQYLDNTVYPIPTTFVFPGEVVLV